MSKRLRLEARLRYCNALGTLIVKAMSLSYIDTVSGVVFVPRSQRSVSKKASRGWTRLQNLPTGSEQSLRGVRV